MPPVRKTSPTFGAEFAGYGGDDASSVQLLEKQVKELTEDNQKLQDLMEKTNNSARGDDSAAVQELEIAVEDLRDKLLASKRTAQKHSKTIERLKGESKDLKRQLNSGSQDDMMKEMRRQNETLRRENQELLELGANATLDTKSARNRARGILRDAREAEDGGTIEKGMQVKFKEFAHSDWNEGHVVDVLRDTVRVKYSDESGRTWQMRIPNRQDRVQNIGPALPARKRHKGSQQSYGGDEDAGGGGGNTVQNLRRENRALRRQLDAEKIRMALQSRLNPREKITMTQENHSAPRGKKCIITGSYVEVFSETYQKWLPARVQSTDGTEVVVIYTETPNSSELQTKALDVRSSYIKPLSPEMAQEWAEYLALFQSAPPSEVDEILDVDKVIRLFRHFDIDGDNFLSYAEFMALLQATEDEDLSISEEKFHEHCQYDKGMTVEELRKVYDTSPDANIDRDFYTVFQEEDDADDNFFGLAEEQLREKAIGIDKKYKKLTRDYQNVVQKLNAVTSLDRTLKEQQKASAIMNLAEELKHITKVKESLQQALMEQNPDKLDDLERIFGGLNDQRVARLKARIDTLAEENEEMHDSALQGGSSNQKEMQKLRYEVEELKIELEKHKQLSDQLIAEQSRLKKELNAEQDQHEGTMQALAVEKEKVYRLEQEQQTLMSDAEELIEQRETRRKFEARLKESKFEMEDMQEQLDNAQARAREFDILKGQVDDIIKEKDESYGKNLQEVIEEREKHKEKHEHLMKQIEELGAQFEEARIAPDQLRRSQEELRRQLRDRETENSQVKSQNTKFKAHNTELTRELDRIREELRRSKSEGGRHLADLRDREGKLKIAQEQVVEYSTDAAAKTRQLKQHRLQLIALQHENKDVGNLRQNIDYLQTELNKVLEEVPAERRKLEDQIRALTLAIKQKEEEAAIFGRVEIRKLKGKLEVNGVEQQQTEVLLSEEKQRGAMMLNQLKKLRAKQADTEAQLDATRDDADQRVEEIEDKLTEDLQQTRFALGDLRNALDMERQANKHLQNQAEDDRAKIEILTNRLNNSLSKMQLLSQAINQGGRQTPMGPAALVTPGGLDSKSRTAKLTQHAQNFMSSLQTEVKTEFQSYQQQTRDAARDAFNNLDRDRTSPLSGQSGGRTYLGQTQAPSYNQDWSKTVKTF